MDRDFAEIGRSEIIGAALVRCARDLVVSCLPAVNSSSSDEFTERSPSTQFMQLAYGELWLPHGQGLSATLGACLTIQDGGGKPVHVETADIMVSVSFCTGHRVPGHCGCPPGQVVWPVSQVKRACIPTGQVCLQVGYQGLVFCCRALDSVMLGVLFQ